MRILYNSVHSILEYDEVRLFTELGHTVFPMGVYSNGGKGHYLLPRPSIDGMQEFPELEKISREHRRGDLPREIFEWADVIIDMHMPEFVSENWDKMRDKKVVWRSIGQSTPHVENMIRRMRYDGMKIVRMSQKEENIVGYVGSDALIPFYKDSWDWLNWNGNEKRAMNLTQTLLGRRNFCHYDSIMQVAEGFPFLVYGSGNADLGGLDGGELPYDLIRGALRDNRVFIYGGTWPSPYTLALQEAMMTGIPIVAIGEKLANSVVPEADRINYYELPNIIKNGENGFISDNVNELRDAVHNLLEDHGLAKKISEKGRSTAIRLWGKQAIKEKWEDFFKTL